MPKRGGYPVGHPRRYTIRSPSGKVEAYGKTPKDAWHNFYLQEKRAGRVNQDGTRKIPLGVPNIDLEIKKLMRGF